MAVNFSDYSDLENIVFSLNDTKNLVMILQTGIFHEDERLSPYGQSLESLCSCIQERIADASKKVQACFLQIDDAFKQTKKKVVMLFGRKIIC